MHALWMQCKVEFLKTFRNRMFLFFSLFMPIMFYYIFTNLVNRDLPFREEWEAHYLMSMALFSLISSSVCSLGITFVYENKLGWSKMIRLTPLKEAFYFLAKMMAQLLINLVSVILIFLFGYVVNDVQLSISQWVMCMVWIVLASIPFMALGAIVGSLNKVETATALSNILLFGLAIVGGLWMPVNQLPEFLQQISKWLPSYRAGEGAWNLINGQSISWETIMILMVYFVVFMILSVYIRRKRQEPV
ncbi:MAG: ABC transporter permease [Bacillus sp. (in: Bacteria)]|nr:ABC transporter permease [Bacillus sp. (in: firmicutes)]